MTYGSVYDKNKEVFGGENIMAQCELCGKDVSFFDDSGVINGKKACKSCIIENQKNTVESQSTDTVAHTNNQQQVTSGITLEPQTRQMIGLMGCIMLFIGVFTPLIKVPFIGEINYIANGKGDGIIILILAVISLFLVLGKNYKGLYFTGFCSASLMIFTYVNIQSRISEMKQGLNKTLSGNPFKELADAAAQAVQIQWGWAFLIIGVILLFVAASANSEVNAVDSNSNTKQSA